MSATEPLLQIEGVRKTYEDFEVLRGVDLVSHRTRSSA